MAHPARPRDFIDRAIGGERDARGTRVALAYHTHPTPSVRSFQTSVIEGDEAGRGTVRSSGSSDIPLMGPIYTTGDHPATVSGSGGNIEIPWSGREGGDAWVISWTLIVEAAEPVIGYLATASGGSPTAALFGFEALASVTSTASPGDTTFMRGQALRMAGGGAQVVLSATQALLVDEAHNPLLLSVACQAFIPGSATAIDTVLACIRYDAVCVS